MKALYCCSCRDLVRLQADRRTCSCGLSAGYLDGDRKPHVTPTAVVLGGDSQEIGNSVLGFLAGGGERSAAVPIFVLPVTCYVIEEEQVS